MTKLFLIRHGQTDWNKEKRYCGCRDIGLNRTGQAQAKKLARRLKKEEVREIYSSDRGRALQTAAIVFEQRKIEKLAGLRELNFGIFEGLTQQVIMTKYPVLYQKWLGNPFGVSIPRAEDLGEFKKRVMGAFKKIIARDNDKDNQTLTVVSHGGVISVFINSILKTKRFWECLPAGASLSVVEHDDGRFRLRVFNDTSHLKYG